MKEKEIFMQEAYENGYILFFEHDLYHECCTLELSKRGIRAGKTLTIEEI